MLIRPEIGSNSQSSGSKWGLSMHNNNIIIDLFAAWTQHPSSMESLITVFHPNPDAEGLNAFSSPKPTGRDEGYNNDYILY